MKYSHYILIVLFIMFSNSLVQGIEKKIYVSPNGVDTNIGTLEHPWQTPSFAIQQACDFLHRNSNKEVKVIFLPGTYNIKSKISINNLSQKLTLTSSVLGKAIFDGGTVINNIEELHPANYMHGKLFRATLPNHIILFPSFSEDQRLEIFINGKRLQPARNPNEGFLRTGDVFGINTTKENTFKEGIFSYSDTSLDILQNESDAWLHGFWCYDWADSYQKVKQIDTTNKILSLEGEHYYGFKKNAKFYALNSYAYLDSVGEYYLDRKHRILYWIASNTANIHNQKIIIADMPSDYMLEITNCTNMTIDGISFCNGNRAINMMGGSHNMIENSHIYQITSDAVHFHEGMDLHLNNCLIEKIGGNGIVVSGGNRKDLTPSECSITNNIFQDISYYSFAFHRAISFHGCGMYIAYNHFYNMPSAAIWAEGNDVLVEHNLFENIALKCDDQGAFDMHYDPSQRGIVLHANYWKNIGEDSRNKCAAIRLDDMISGQQIDGNYFENCGSKNFGAIQINGGKDNKIYNNTFYNCPLVFSCSPFGEKWEQELQNEAMKEKLYKNVNIESIAYKTKYPELNQDIHQNVDRNYFYQNKIANCTHIFLHTEKNIIHENSITQSNIPPTCKFDFGPHNNPYQQRETK